MNSLTYLFVLIAAVCITSVHLSRWDDSDNSKNDDQNNNDIENPFLYSDFFIKRNSDANNDDQNNNNIENPFLYSDFFIKRQLAAQFNREMEDAEDNDDDDGDSDIDKRLLKHDAEEVREIDAKTMARRRKAYKNYEESCKIKGKFTVRTCPKIEDCFAKNKQKFLPILDTSKTTPAPTTTKPKGRREFIERALASSYLDWNNSDDDDTASVDDDDDDDDFDFVKRLLWGKNASAELIEETKERKGKAFKKYEEYCEKRLFRINAQRNCPPLNAKLC